MGGKVCGEMMSCEREWLRSRRRSYWTVAMLALQR